MFIRDNPKISVGAHCISGDSKFQSKLDSRSKKIARDEIHEIESDMVSAVQSFRKWVLDQKDWLKSPTGRTD